MFDPEQHLIERLARLDNSYKDSWPKWNNDDYYAVKDLLRRVNDPEITQEQVSTIFDGMLGDRRSEERTVTERRMVDRPDSALDSDRGNG